MAYYQAHLLLLAGYSQFFVSGLVLPRPEVDSDDEFDDDMEEIEVEEITQPESPQAEPMAVEEPCPTFPADNVLSPEPSPEQRRRKRLSAVSESHVRAISRWLRDSAGPLGDQQLRQSPDPDSTLREGHETKRLCTARSKPRLPALQTSFTFLPPRLSVA